MLFIYRLAKDEELKVRRVQTKILSDYCKKKQPTLKNSKYYSRDKEK